MWKSSGTPRHRRDVGEATARWHNLAHWFTTRGAKISARWAGKMTARGLASARKGARVDPTARRSLKRDTSGLGSRAYENRVSHFSANDAAAVAPPRPPKPPPPPPPSRKARRRAEAEDRRLPRGCDGISRHDPRGMANCLTSPPRVPIPAARPTTSRPSSCCSRKYSLTPRRRRTPSPRRPYPTRPLSWSLPQRPRRPRRP